VQTNDRLVYLDSSAIVKLIVDERETTALRGFLAGYPHRVSSILAKVEVMRAARSRGQPAAVRANLILQTLSIITITDEVAEIAGRLQPSTLRSLDALHVAAALILGSALATLVTYDGRMASAARHADLRVESPA
jgi:uncharacterized protein